MEIEIVAQIPLAQRHADAQAQIDHLKLQPFAVVVTP
jgi:hypothetical protein